jgi:hypothetical protein
MRSTSLPLIALLALPACGGGRKRARMTPIVADAAPPPHRRPPGADARCRRRRRPATSASRPVESNTPATRLTIRLYILTNDKGKQIRNYDPEKIPVGWHLTLDAVAKDVEGRETNGEKILRWFIDNPGLVEQGGNHPHQTKITPTAEGTGRGLRQAGRRDVERPPVRVRPRGGVGRDQSARSRASSLRTSR